MVSDIWKNKLLYTNYNDENSSVIVYDIKKDKLINIADGTQLKGQAIFANKVLYIDISNNRKLYLYNLRSKNTKVISENVAGARIWGKKIVWYIPKPHGYYEVAGYDLKNDEYFYFGSNSKIEHTPDIRGNKIVWIEDLAGKYRINLYNITAESSEILFESSNILSYPRISNKYVTFVDNKGDGSHDISLINLHTKQVTEISNDGPQQPSPTISEVYKNELVWMSWHEGNGDIFRASS